jgi:hypothetical protein
VILNWTGLPNTPLGRPLCSKKNNFGKVYQLESVSTTHGANRGAKMIFLSMDKAFRWAAFKNKLPVFGGLWLLHRGHWF